MRKGLYNEYNYIVKPMSKSSRYRIGVDRELPGVEWQ